MLAEFGRISRFQSFLAEFGQIHNFLKILSKISTFSVGRIWPKSDLLFTVAVIGRISKCRWLNLRKISWQPWLIYHILANSLPFLTWRLSRDSVKLKWRRLCSNVMLNWRRLGSNVKLAWQLWLSSVRSNVMTFPNLTFERRRRQASLTTLIKQCALKRHKSWWRLLNKFRTLR